MAGEWLLTNGLGGYALGPLDGPPARGYHGFLVAATMPPDGRVLLVGPIKTWLEVDGVETRLDALEDREGHVEGRAAGIAPGLVEHGLPTWTFEVDGVAIEQQAWMIRDANATVVRWRRLDLEGGRRVRLRVTPLVAGHDHHPSGQAAAEPATVVIGRDGAGASADIELGHGLPTIRLAASRGDIRREDRVVTAFHAEDAARGTSPEASYRAVVTIDAGLEAGGELVLVLATTSGSMAAIPGPGQAAATRAAAIARRLELVGRAMADPDSEPAALVIAADQFLVRRPARRDGPVAADDPGRTVIAGYPWFGDWGRDTMIALPGLTLATGRHDEAGQILRTWAGLLRDGLLPNLFPDASGGTPAYHAVDAPLWFVHALGAYEAATGDPALAVALRPAVESIIAAYHAGTAFGIGVDPSDGLVRAGAPGMQLTWMDARVDGVPITPRHGKPVEIQALWVNALRRASSWAAAAGLPAEAAAHDAAAALAESSFRARFRARGTDWLRDVVDGPDGDDPSLRPNQLLALSLPHPLVDDATARGVLDAVERHLLVPGGIRTLAPFESAYRPWFQGPPAARDGAYHQGAAWTWLLGPWIDAVARFRGPDAAREQLDAALAALDPDRMGAIPELLEPEPPHARRGCPWQAWGVAELLRASRTLGA